MDNFKDYALQTMAPRQAGNATYAQDLDLQGLMGSNMRAAQGPMGGGMRAADQMQTSQPSLFSTKNNLRMLELASLAQSIMKIQMMEAKTQDPQEKAQLQQYRMKIEEMLRQRAAELGVPTTGGAANASPQAQGL